MRKTPYFDTTKLTDFRLASRGTYEPYYLQVKPQLSCGLHKHTMSFTCSICLGDYEEESRVTIPCCGRATSTIVFCHRCLEIICERAPSSAGRCPTCNGYFRIGEDGSVEVAERVAQCHICRQTRTIIDQDLCGQCIIGERYPLIYECSGCHGLQRIYHPMWKYQPSLQEFGTSTWACHVGCGDYKAWRIKASEVEHIPAQEVPESWGLREDWLGQVRAQRQAEIEEGLRRLNMGEGED